MRDPRSGTFQLTALSGPLDGLTVVIQQWPVTIGRSTENTVALQLDVWASRQHARLDYQDGQVWLEDVGDLNITAVGRQLVRGRVPLAPESTFRVGHTLIRLERVNDGPEETRPGSQADPKTGGNPLDSSQFSPAVRQIIITAITESARLRHYYLGVEHLFIAASQPGGALTQALLHLGLQPELVQARLRVEAGPGSLRRPWQGIILTPRADRLLTRLAGARAAATPPAAPVSEADLADAILEDPDALPTRWLREQGYDPAALQAVLQETLSAPPKPVRARGAEPL